VNGRGWKRKGKDVWEEEVLQIKWEVSVVMPQIYSY
jgi:hypothetical protein